MKDQPWDLNQTWHVRRKWCRFINAPQKFRGPSPKNLGSKKTSHFDLFLATFALDTPYLRNETSHRQTKILLSICNMSSTSWSTFRYLWPRNGWDSLAHLDPPMKIQHFSNLCRKNLLPYKVFCVKTSSGKVVSTSFPYLTVHRWIAVDVPIYLKFAIKVTHPMKIQLFLSFPGFPHKGQ